MWRPTTPRWGNFLVRTVALRGRVLECLIVWFKDFGECFLKIVKRRKATNHLYNCQDWQQSCKIWITEPKVNLVTISSSPFTALLAIIYGKNVLK